MHRLPHGWGLMFAVAVFAVDRSTKLLALWNLDPERPLALLPFLNLVLVANPGVSFGLFSGLGRLAPWVLVAAILAVCLVLVWWLIQEQRPLARLALWAILGGAAGNLFDRLRYGAVIDFLDLYVGRYHWPTFNLADVAVVGGAAALLVDSFRARPRAVKSGGEGG